MESRKQQPSLLADAYAVVAIFVTGAYFFWKLLG